MFGQAVCNFRLICVVWSYDTDSAQMTEVVFRVQHCSRDWRQKVMNSALSAAKFETKVHPHFWRFRTIDLWSFEVIQVLQNVPKFTEWLINVCGCSNIRKMFTKRWHNVCVYVLNLTFVIYLWLYFFSCHTLWHPKFKYYVDYPLSPHDALKHHFTSLKTDLFFLQLRVLDWKFPWNWLTNTW